MFSFLLSYKLAGSRAAFGARPAGSYRGRFIYMDVSMGLSL